MMEEEISGSLNVDLAQAETDSPSYRANIQYCEDQFEVLHKWTDQSLKLQQVNISEWKSMNQLISSFYLCDIYIEDNIRAMEIAKSLGESSNMKLFGKKPIQTHQMILIKTYKPRINCLTRRFDHNTDPQDPVRVDRKLEFLWNIMYRKAGISVIESLAKVLG